jgi:hypothetical protein
MDNHMYHSSGKNISTGKLMARIYELEEAKRKADGQINYLQRKVATQNSQLAILRAKEKTHSTVVCRTITEQLPISLVRHFGPYMPIPSLYHGNQLPSGGEMRAWTRKSPGEKLHYWKKQPAINFIQSFQHAINDPGLSYDLNSAIARIKRRAEASGVTLPAGEFYKGAITKSLQALSRQFNPLSQKIHTTGMPFSASEIMEAADQAVLTSSDPDRKYWEWISRLLECQAI